MLGKTEVSNDKIIFPCHNYSTSAETLMMILMGCPSMATAVLTVRLGSRGQVTVLLMIFTNNSVLVMAMGLQGRLSGQSSVF